MAEPDTAHLDWRLTKLEEQVKEGFGHIEARFDRLTANIQSLAYVSQREYDRGQSDQDKRMTDIETRQAWVLGLLISAIVVALVGGLVRLAAS